MIAAPASIWERTPWWGAVTVGFFLSVGGQWAINEMVDIINVGKADLTPGQQALLAGGAVLTAAGTALIGRGAPTRPQGMDRWESFWWGPVTVMLSALVLLMSLICVWIIPESIVVYRESGGADKPLTAILATAVTLVALAISLALTLYLRRSASNDEASPPDARVPMASPAPSVNRSDSNVAGALIWAAALLFVALIAPSRTNEPSLKDQT